MTTGATQDRPRLPPAYRLVALGRVDSSNDEAKRLAEAGAEDGTLVWVQEQLQGRGRRGRAWASPPGNLYLSLVLRPGCAAAEAAQLGFVAALGIGDGVGSVAPPLVEVRYKWPNDVLFNGRKGAGILLESRMSPAGDLDWLVLGLGVNVTSFPEDAGLPATSLRFEGAPPDLDEVDLLEAFARHFLAWANRWREDGFGPIRETWLRRAQGLGEPIEVRLPNETLSGRFRDLDQSGALLLEQPDGQIRSIAAGDVYFGA
jgi:BirA family biotin operon repressor/biotin-[acetyl-CoA-carboxylase] ligase